MNCPECGAPESLCSIRFDELLLQEFTNADYAAVHHLTVATYMLQHSSKLTRDGWHQMRSLLKEFLVGHKSPSFIRRQNRARVDSGKRKFNLASKDGFPVIDKSMWTRTILDVRMENAEIYRADVTLWAKSALDEADKIEAG